MEEQIKQLAEEAGFLTENGKFYADSFDAINDKLEEFAKLIIETCMDIADNSIDHGLPSAYIAKHFGMEVEYD